MSFVLVPDADLLLVVGREAIVVIVVNGRIYRTRQQP